MSEFERHFNFIAYFIYYYASKLIKNMKGKKKEMKGNHEY